MSGFLGFSGGSVDQVRYELAVNTLRDQLRAGAAGHSLIDGWADEFEDATGVDAAASSGETYDTSGDYYHNPASVSADQVPTMTTNTAPSGTVFSSPGDQGGWDRWQAFNDSNSNGWQTSAGTTGIIGYQFTSGKIARGYSITGMSAGLENRSPKDWTFQGSNDGSTYTTLDTQTGVTGWSALQKRSYTFANTTSYSYYRLNVTANDGGVLLGVYEVEIFVGVAAPDMALICNSVTVSAAPSLGYGLVVVEEVETLAANSTIYMDISSDAGSTWGQLVLEDLGTITFGTTTCRIFAGSGAVGGASTSMRYRVRLVGKEARLHGVWAFWG